MYESELLHAPRHIINLQSDRRSAHTIDRISYFHQKTDLQPPNSFNPTGRPDSHPPILLFEEKLGKPSIPALRVM